MGLERRPGIVRDRRLSQDAGAVQFFTEDETMLVLQRRVGECFILQDKTTGERIVVQQMKGGRLGIIASNNVRILREELIERKEAA